MNSWNIANSLDLRDVKQQADEDCEEDWSQPLQFNAKRFGSLHHDESGGIIGIGDGSDGFTATYYANDVPGIQQKNIIVTCNYVAREQGVTKLMYLADAKRKCPNLVLVSGEDLTHYRKMSYLISDFLQKYTSKVERLGFDENFIDVSEMVQTRLSNGKYTPKFVGNVFSLEDVDDAPCCKCGCELRLQIGSQIAADIREALNAELGITCCAGISHNKLLAKLVGSTHKPNKQTSLPSNLALQFISSLSSVRCIPGIGSAMTRKLGGLGIVSVRDLQSVDTVLLDQHFGAGMAQTLRQLSFGVDDSAVTTFDLPQTISDEDSFKCLNNLDDVHSHLKKLITSLLSRLEEDGRHPQTLRLTIRKANNNYARESRQCPIPTGIFKHPLASSAAVCDRLMPTVLNLFRKIVDTSKPFTLTLINICFAKLVQQGNTKGKISSFLEARSDSVPAQEVEESGGISCEIVSQTTEEIKAGKQVPSVKTINTFFVNRVPCCSGQTSTGDVAGALNKSEDANACLKTSKTNSALQESQGTELSSPNKKKDKFINNSCSLNQEVKSSVCGERAKSSPKASSQRLLPSDLDLQTVMELPSDIQQEIFQTYGISAISHTGKLNTTAGGSDNLVNASYTSAKKSTVKPIFRSSVKSTRKSSDQSSPSLKRKLFTSHVEIGTDKKPALTNVFTSSSSGKVSQTGAKGSMHYVEDRLNASPEESCVLISDGKNQPPTSESFSKAENSLPQMNKASKRENIHSVKTCINTDSKIQKSSNVLKNVNETSYESTETVLRSKLSHIVQSIPSKIGLKGFPADIDSSVFSELPCNIQGEIMAHVVMGNNPCSSSTARANSVSRNPHLTKQKPKEKGQKNILNFFCKK